MKKNFLVLLLCMIALFSCQNNETNLLPENEINPEKTAYELSRVETERLLSNFIKVVKPTVNTKSGGQFKIVDSRRKYSENILTRSGENSKVAFYEFNMEIENEENYAMVCADKRLPMVITFIKGNMPINDNNQSSVPKEALAHINATLSAYESDFFKIIAEREKLPDPLLDYWFTGFPPFGSVKDMLYTGEKDEVYFLKESITWDQRHPYNSALDDASNGAIDSLTGRKVKNRLGCANVALLNLMARNSRPKTFYWRAYADTPVLSDLISPSDISKAVDLCKAVYNATNSKSDTSGATTTTIPDLYTGMDIMELIAAPVYAGFNIELIKGSLKYARPVIVAANDNASTSKVGHIFVVRGWWKSTNTYPLHDNKEISAESIAINWGYPGGFGDGWYCSYFDGGGFEAGVRLRPIVLNENGVIVSPKDWSRNMQLISHIDRRGAYIPPLPPPMN